ncbi:hypothetical protein D3C71_1289100 [compost metagenome]
MVAAQQYLATGQGGHEPLEEVANLVIGVATEIEPLLQVETERHPGIGVSTPQHQHGPVQKDAQVEQAGEGVAALTQQQQRQDDQHGGDFQQPGDPVIGLPAGEHQQYQGEQQQQEFLMRCHREPVREEEPDFMV